MGEFIGEHFVATHQQVGDFEAVNVNGRVKKNGGNVASYFLTPTGRVIHSVVGPVTAKKLLLEAKWATDAYAAVKNMPLKKQMQHMSQVHMLAAAYQTNGWNVQNWQQLIEQQLWRRGGSKDHRVHLLLGSKPLAPVAKVYEEVFHHILGQKVSKAAPNLAYDSLPELVWRQTHNRSHPHPQGKPGPCRSLCQKKANCIAYRRLWERFPHHPDLLTHPFSCRGR